MKKRRQNIAAGNWKMNMNYDDGLKLLEEIVDSKRAENVMTVIGTPFIHLDAAVNLTKGYANISIAAQNVHHEMSGAFTGEVSAGMLASLGVKYVIIGHSERREYQGEDSALIARKIELVLSNNMIPIFCCGEVLEIRKAGNHVAHVSRQVEEALFGFDAESIKDIVIAYEPVWAIGTGETASPEQAQEMHLAIRRVLADRYSEAFAESISILYGGSVKADNAREIFAKKDVDGGLVGGASLKLNDFVSIINSF